MDRSEDDTSALIALYKYEGATFFIFPLRTDSIALLALYCVGSPICLLFAV
jgi:hypothetical protein